jgi:hypothetical protein
MGDEAEHGDFGIASGIGAAVVRDVIEGVGQAAEVLDGQGAARSGNSLAGSLLIYFREGRRAGKKLLGVFKERIDPVFFRAFLIDIEFDFMAFEAFAEAQRRPVAGFVDGTFVKLRIAEALGEEGTVSVFFLEVIGEFAQAEPHAAGGEVGFAPGFQDEKSSELGDEWQAASSGERIPVDPFIAILEPQSRSRPAQHGAKHRVAVIRTGLVNPLPDGVSSGSSGFEVVLVVEGGAQLADLEFCGGLPDFEALTDGIERRADMNGVDHPLNLAILGPKSRKS